MIGFLMNALGVNKAGAWLITVASAGAVLWGANLLFDNWLNGVKREAMTAQRTADELAYKDAALKAERTQNDKIDAARKEGIQIGKETAYGYVQDTAATDTAAAALAGLWRAEAQAHSGGAGRRQATGISDAGASPALAAACEAQGWVSLPLAVLLAAGADKEASRGDRLSEFLTRNAAKWPKSTPIVEDTTDVRD